MILNDRNQDVTALFFAAADTAGISRRLAVGCAIAESELNPTNERWGTKTKEAQAAMARTDWPALQRIIDQVWADISFGYGQQIVKYHYHGTHEATWQNCLDVRAAVFADPVENVYDMCRRLRSYLNIARQQQLEPVGGDAELGACVIYNVGHYPLNATEWLKADPHLDRYRKSLARAEALINEIPAAEALINKIPASAPQVKGAKTMSTIEERAAAEGPDRLGNQGEPETGVYTLHADEGDLRLQVFYNKLFLEYTHPSGEQRTISFIDESLVPNWFQPDPA